MNVAIPCGILQCGAQDTRQHLSTWKSLTNFPAFIDMQSSPGPTPGAAKIKKGNIYLWIIVHLTIQLSIFMFFEFILTALCDLALLSSKRARQVC